MLSPVVADAFAAIRRNAALILVVGVLGAVVAGVLTVVGAEAAYTGTATIAVNDLSLSRLPTIAGSERVLRDLHSTEYYEDVAASGIIDSAEAASINTYSNGVPVTAILVTYTSPDADVAEQVAGVAAEVAMDRIDALNAEDVTRQEAILAGADSAVAAIDAAAGETDWEDADLAVKVFSVEANRANAQYTLDLIDAAYTLEPEVTVAEATPARSPLQNAIGAGILGLALGVVIALVRERVGVKRA